MSDFIRFTKEGLKSFHWDGEAQEYLPGKPKRLKSFHWDGEAQEYLPDEKEQSQIKNLRVRCEIADGVTLGDIFKAVEGDPLLMNAIADYAWCPWMEEFHQQVKLPPPEPKPDDVKMVALKIEPIAEFRQYKPEDELVFEGIWYDFTGLGEDGVRYSISYTPVNEIAALPVHLIDQCSFTKNFEPSYTAKVYPSLLDVLDAIYWDISFHGGPEDNATFIEELHGMMEEIKNGTAKTVPFDLHDLD